MIKETTGLIIYVVLAYIAYKIFQPEIKETIIKLKTLKKPLRRKTKKINTNKKI